MIKKGSMWTPFEDRLLIDNHRSHTARHLADMLQDLGFERTEKSVQWRRQKLGLPMKKKKVKKRKSKGDKFVQVTLIRPTVEEIEFAVRQIEKHGGKCEVRKINTGYAVFRRLSK